MTILDLSADQQITSEETNIKTMNDTCQLQEKQINRPKGKDTSDMEEYIILTIIFIYNFDCSSNFWPLPSPPLLPLI